MAIYNWAIDPAHSNINFSIRHLVIATVTGSFNIFSGTMVTTGPDHFEDASINFTIDVYSIDTNSRDRDEHLKSADFFNADEFPSIGFRSTAFRHIDGDTHKLTGLLNIKGITKEVTLDVLFGGIAKDGFGIMRAGFDITGSINRNDFDIHANDVTEAGGLVLAEIIRLHAGIQFIHEV
jgi:polyisoprenoid-binding protein YceI